MNSDIVGPPTSSYPIYMNPENRNIGETEDGSPTKLDYKPEDLAFLDTLNKNLAQTTNKKLEHTTAEVLHKPSPPTIL